MTRDPQLYLTHGDTVTVEIDRLGRLTNQIVIETEIPRPMNQSGDARTIGT